MFNTLKRKFVIINMCLLSLVFVSIFSAIYILTAHSAQRQTNFALEKAISGPARPFPDNPVMGSTIIVDLDAEGKIKDSFPLMITENETVKQAVEEISAVNSSSGNIRIGETYFSFLKRQTPRGTKVAFVDRTPQQRTLNNLLVGSVSVGSLSLIVLFLISIYLADRAVKPIKEAFEKQSQFIADASHELKTPLTVIETNAALVLDSKEDTVSSQAKWIEYILFQTKRMSSLLDNMLSLARMESTPGPTVSKSEFDLGDAVTGSFLSFEAVLFERKIESVVDIEPGVMFKGDKEGIKQLVDILMDNAVKNTPEGGRITLSLSTGGNIIKFKIRNTGKGIPPEHLEKIFERFYRVDSSRSRESGGYGLGLSIAKAIVDQHKGKIYAESNVGVDSTFFVELPQ